MAKKTKKHPTRLTHHATRGNRRHRGDDKKLTQQILARCYLASKKLRITDLIRTLTLPPSARESINPALDALCREKRLTRKGKNHIALGPRHGLAEATLEMNQAGFGFAVNLTTPTGVKQLEKDPYISAARLGAAMHGDRVLLEIIRDNRDGRPEAEIIRVIERTRECITGFFRAGSRHATVYPDDPRFPFEITITSAVDPAVNEGDAVIVRVHETNRSGRTFNGDIVEILGDPSLIEVQFRLVAEKFNLPLHFSTKAQQEALEATASETENRQDLRNVTHVTIDGEDARDFDDAIGVEKRDDGWRLYVSIADVGAFVKIGTHLDQEAYERGTSVYFPGTVIPMLPEHLSNNLCSLLPDTDRLTYTAILDFNRQGDLVHKKFCKSIIRSSQRFTYKIVTQIIIDKDPTARRRHNAFLPLLEQAAELATTLKMRREKRGALAFSIPEAHIQLDENGRVVALGKAERGFAHEIIEAFMLAANEAVAREFNDHAQDLLYRIHGEPSPDKVTDFATFSTTLGLTRLKDPGTHSWYNKLLALVRGTSHEYIVNNLLLRTLQQAGYSPDKVGHFALATDLYCHFTSPIRRYPDLIVHRLLSQLQSDERPKKRCALKKKFAPVSSLQEAGQHLSNCERTAIHSERDMAERLKLRFMAERIGESFPAVISGVAESVFFVELLDNFVSGAVPLASITDDYYLLDAKRHRVIGDVGGRVFQIGDLVEVVLTDVDPYRNRVTFALTQRS